MLTAQFENIKSELEKLEGVTLATVVEKFELDETELKAKEKQDSFFEAKITSLRASFVYIETDEASAILKLQERKNSTTIIKLKDAATRIINQYIHEYNATHDKLTGIYNRLGLEKAIKNADKFNYITYCISDIDNFKQINDTFSHQYGDSVLIMNADKLSEKCKQLSSNDRKLIYSRLGGEEFVTIILSDKPEHQLAEEIRSSICFTEDEKRTEIKSSLGYATQENKKTITKEDLDKLYKEADIALYKSKKEGKNQTTNYLEIRKSLGKIIECDSKHKIIAIDIGKNCGVMDGDFFTVYPEKYTGRVKFILDDGRSKKPIGDYPKISSGHIRAKYIQDEISFCIPIDSEEFNFEQNSRLELLEDQAAFELGFKNATEE